MMSARARPSPVVCIWLIVIASSGPTVAERWSRQVSNSDWIPLANPRSQQGQATLAQGQNLPPIPQIHQPLIPSSLPPELRQEYQQQLLQLQKTQESIQRLLLLQQELKAQQQLLQSQGFPPNGIAENEETKHQGSVSNSPTLPELSSDVLVPPPQLSAEDRPPVYTSQNFREPQGETIGQEQYEDYSDRQAEDYRNSERTRESLRDKEKYVPEGPSGPSNTDDGEEEVQVVYVPAEVLAQRGQAKNQRGRDRKQYGNQDSRHQHQQHQQRPLANHRGQSSLESTSRERDVVPTTVSPQEDAYAREFLQQLQREHEGTDRLLKEARQKELDRLREERKEIQRQAKLQQAALEREQEIQRQRDAEKKRKELEKLEESAKQRELERIRGAREKQRQEELERSKKAQQQARANQERRKQEEARQAEVERLAALERQKKAELEKTIKAQKELERAQKQDEERQRESTPQAEPLIRSQHNHQQHHGGKYNRNRVRNKPRQRQHHVNTEDIESFERDGHETTTVTPPSPNQPPLAVYMINQGGNTRVLRISDVLKTLKDAKTIDVLDNVGPDAPHVFVGPSNLEVTADYSRFELPYLSSIDNNRVERRVDKLPFFVAPLSFNPPPGYSKIPFPAPHIGSVVVNTLDEHLEPTQPEDSYEDVRKPGLNPVIEPNSYIESSNQGVSYSTAYDASTTPSYTKYRQEEPPSTLQYQSTPSYSSVEANAPGQRFRFRQQFGGESPSSAGSQDQTPPRGGLDPSERPQRPAFQEELALPQSNRASQYSDESSGSTTPTYRRPNVVTSFTYQDSPQPGSSTPVYQQSYSHVRDDSTIRHPNSQVHEDSTIRHPNSQVREDSTIRHPNSQVREDSTIRHPNSQSVLRDHDLPEHRERYQQGGDLVQEYPSGPVDSGANPYEDPALRGPTQYNLPAELPPIIPQLPGLVNSLLDEGEQAAFVNRQHSTTTEPTTTTTTTTEAPTTTTHRSRGRHRGRVVATRPRTTTTTTPSPTSRSRDNERTRRPVSRTRSRYTTTTEEYRDTYEPTRSKTSETTQRYSSQDSYRRPAQKFRGRDSETSLQGSRNQVHNVQSHEADGGDRTPVLESNLRLPETTGIESEPVYQQYNFASSTTGLENYPVPSGEERKPVNPVGTADYTKNLNYPQALEAPVDGLRNQEEPTGQQYQEPFPADDFRPPLENAPINGFNYETRNEQVQVTPTIPPTSRDYAFYQNTQDNFQGSQDPRVPTEAPVNPQVHNFQRPETYEQQSQDPGRVQNEELARPQVQFPPSEDKTQSYGANDGAIYDPYSADNQDHLGSPNLGPQQAPFELTTEATTTTTTTTEPTAPLVIRQRVRGRLGARGRQDPHIQTRPRGTQDEYVRFSAVNNQNAPTTERPTTRHRENPRLRPKARHQYHGTVQVQTEGNDYVRIQAPIRTYQKTIVTPPSTTRRTTTTPAPTTTTTVSYEEDSNDGLEYGFIRPPNFSPVHPVENRPPNFYRPVDNQAQLQSIAPTDETAEDSSLSHTQVSRNRPKYQSPNRRPSVKPATTTTTAASTIAAYTERPRTRVEEPKSNRIRVRGRKPGRRRTTTTTTTTTEYVLEDTNDLPLEENYPRRVEDPINDRQGLYDERFEALPLASGDARSPVHEQNDEIPYTGQDFVLNFGAEQTSPELDQTQLASQPPPRKYGQAFGSRSRSHSTHRGGQDRDIHGAESQWSTKLTSSSFQPSPSANRLPQDARKSSGFFDAEKSKYANDQAAADAPEIITAAPEESYVTVLVTSDDKEAKSVSGEAMEAPSMEGTNYGMKMGVEGRSTVLENSTSISGIRDTDGPESSVGVGSSTESVFNGGTENFSDGGTNRVPTRRMGGRRRRVRVRVRPAPTDDFVTAESQHFNSAVNSLFQDRLKYNRFMAEPKEIPTTLPPPTPQEHPTSEAPEKTIFEDFLDQMFKGENKSSTETAVTTSDQPEEITTMKSVELDSHQERQETSTDFNAETTTTVVFDADSNATNDAATNDDSTSAPVTTTTSIPRKSWDSTKQYIDSIAMQSGEYLTNSRYPENAAFDDNLTGQGNEVFNNDYRQNVPNDDDASGVEDTNDENHPKNHRSQWSEVRYPTDRGLFNYNRKMNLTATQLPGVVTKTDGDANVKTLSDYVKAIFDTMKNADEQKIDDFPTTSSSTEDTVTTVNPSTDTEKVPEEDPTTVTSTSDSTTVSEVFTGRPEKFGQTVRPNETETVKSGPSEEADEFSGRTENPEEPNTESRTEKEEPTEQPRNSEAVETTKMSDTTTEVFSETTSASSPALGSESSQNLTTENSNATEDVTTTTTTTTTTEDSPMAMVSAKLSGVLRTSTTTKVSHMTEICYRGRCVMTKPKKEFRER